MKFGLTLVAALLLAYPAHAQPTGYLTVNDYPPAAVKEGREGTVTFEVSIDKGGRARACRILKSSGHADLDETTCIIMVQRLRFVPAQDETGNPAEGTYSSSVTWQLDR